MPPMLRRHRPSRCHITFNCHRSGPVPHCAVARASCHLVRASWKPQPFKPQTCDNPLSLPLPEHTADALGRVSNPRLGGCEAGREDVPTPRVCGRARHGVPLPCDVDGSQVEKILNPKTPNKP